MGLDQAVTGGVGSPQETPTQEPGPPLGGEGLGLWGQRDAGVETAQPGRRTRPCSPCTAHCQAGPLHRQRRCWGRRGPPCPSRGDMKVAVAVATCPAARESGRSARGSACSALAHLRFRSIPRRVRPTDAPSPPPTASDRPSLPSSGLGRTPSPPRPGPRGRLFPATSACRALPVTQVTSLCPARRSL